MYEFLGKKWGELKESEQKSLLYASYIENTKDSSTIEGKCKVCFGKLIVDGSISYPVENEHYKYKLVIDDDAIIYDPTMLKYRY